MKHCLKHTHRVSTNDIWARVSNAAGSFTFPCDVWSVSLKNIRCRVTLKLFTLSNYYKEMTSNTMKQRRESREICGQWLYNVVWLMEMMANALSLWKSCWVLADIDDSVTMLNLMGHVQIHTETREVWELQQRGRISPATLTQSIQWLWTRILTGKCFDTFVVCFGAWPPLVIICCHYMEIEQFEHWDKYLLLCFT